MWCFEVQRKISDFSSAVKTLFRSGLPPVFWKAFLPTILKFLSKHAGDSSALDVMRDAGKGSHLDAAYFPAHYYTWSGVLSSLRDDEHALKWLRATMASSFPPAECVNIELLSCSSESERQAMMHRILQGECETNEMTWLIVLKQSTSKEECERIVRSEMPKRGLLPGDAHWGCVMLRCSLKEREAIFQELMSSASGAGLHVWTALIAGQKSAADRESTFDRMVAAGVQPNVHTWSRIIAGYSSGAEKERALERMVAAGVQPDTSTWNAIIAGYSSGAEKERVLERMVAAGVQPDVVTWSAIIAGYSSVAEKERALERMVAASVQPNASTWSGIIAGYSSGAEKEQALERMMAAGVQPNAITWSAIISGYSSVAEKERALERMVAAGVQPHVENLTTIMGGYSSFTDRWRVFQRLTAGPRAVIATRQVVAALFGSPDASDHVQIALHVLRSLPDDLLCGHDVLSNALPLCAEGNDPQLLRRLWDIGAAGLKDSKLGWPGLQIHQCISKMMRERRPQGGCWALLSSLLQGASMAAGVQPNAVTWSAIIAGYSSVAEKERALERMVAAGVQPDVGTWSGIIAGYSSVAEKERALERMVAAGVQPDVGTWSGIIAGYSSVAEKERALERMVAAGVQPNVDTLKTIMGGYSSFTDRWRVFQRLTARPRAVTATKEVVAALFGSPDASDHVQIALPILRSLSDDLLCGHLVLSHALPMCAEGNDPQLLRRLWDIGAAGLKDSKLGWPGLQSPGTHYRISKMMRERRPQGGCWALLSSLLQGASSAHVSPAPGANVALGGAPSSAAAAGGGRGGRDGRGGGGGGAHRPAHSAGGGNVGPGSSVGRGQPAVCRNWSATGTCKYGSGCNFSHR
jgi:hypothetical protein